VRKPTEKTRKSEPKSFTLGRGGFARISAVEGIRLSPEMERRFREFDRLGLSAGDRRKAIARLFVGSGARR
jgi:hypothetical protein